MLSFLLYTYLYIVYTYLYIYIKIFIKNKKVNNKYKKALIIILAH